jgi:GTP-binding protein
VINKVDGPTQEAAATDFFALGIDELVTVSAEHGLGIADLMDRVLELLPGAAPVRADDDETRLAIIGRPNVGKSSLVNRLLGYERMVANPVAGTTRDSVDTPFTYNRRRYVLIDTAGIRRKGRVAQKIEKYTVIQALKALDRADIALMVLDAREGITEQDLTVAGYAYERGRAVVLVINKWDLVPKDHTTAGHYIKNLREAFKFLPEVPIHLVSALTGLRVSKIMADVEKVSDEYRRTIKTAALNKVLEQAQKAHQPPIYHGKRLHFFYMTQTATRPPSFIIFVNKAEGVHFSYRRYLTNCLRQAFGFAGCPIRLHLEDRER